MLTPNPGVSSDPQADYDIVEQVDEELEQVRGTLQADIESLRRELRSTQKKYKSAREKIEQLEIQLDKVETNCSRLLALNLEYQEHMVVCKKVSLK